MRNLFRAFLTSRVLLLYLTLALVVILLAMVGILIKVLFYPGWTWRGYISDAKVLFGIGAALAAAVGWSWHALRGTKFDDSLRQYVAHLAYSRALPLVSIGLASAILGLGVAGVYVKEKEIPDRLWAHMRNSNWSHATRFVDEWKKEPISPDLIESISLFIVTHERSERDRLRESVSIRQDRDRIRGLIQEGYDPDFINTLSFAELCKQIHFVEKAAAEQENLNTGLRMIFRQTSSREVPRAQMATLWARAGELELAAKNYARAKMHFEMSLEYEFLPVPRSRTTANLANSLASLSRVDEAIKLYAQAEEHYPEGRRAVFYSNYGYVLMLNKLFDPAKKRIEQALQIDPTDWYSYLNLALVKDELKLYDDALADFSVVISKSEFPDSVIEAKLLAGRTAELASKPVKEYLSYYLEADGRAPSETSIGVLSSDRCAMAALYLRLASRLAATNTHGVEKYIQWFKEKSNLLGRC